MKIVRTVFQRPVLLKLSLEAQCKAIGVENTETFFFVDVSKDAVFVKNNEIKKDTLEKNLEIINEYKYNKSTVVRETNFGVNKNTFEGWKYVFDNYDDNFLIHIEEDALISNDFIKLCQYCIDKKWIKENCFGVAAGTYHVNKGDMKQNLQLVGYGGGFCGRLHLIPRWSFDKLIRPHLSEDYSDWKYIYGCYKDFIDNHCNGAFNHLNPNGGWIGADVLLSVLWRKHKCTSIVPVRTRYGYVGVFWNYRKYGGTVELNTFEYEEQYKILKDALVNASNFCKYANDAERRFWEWDGNVDFGDKLVLINPNYCDDLLNNK